MKKNITLFLFAILTLNSYSQNENDYKAYELWNIVPTFYNNDIRDSTRVYFWENYWYYRNNENNLFPDTLVVSIKAFPSFVIRDYISAHSVEYQIKSTIVFKYGDYDDCFNVINPRCSNKYILMDTVIRYNSLLDTIIKNDGGNVLLKNAKIPMKKILRELKITINEYGENEFLKNAPKKALNQVIVTTQVLDRKGIICQTFEFTFPVSGCYKDEGDINGHEWEF